MKSEVLANFSLVYLPVIGLFLFLSVFLGACFWVFRKNSKDFYKNLGRIPFQKEEQ